jgi:putative transposase
VLRRPIESTQYGSRIFGRTLRESGLVQSMGARGSALDNAACESVIATFKTELVHRRSFRTRDEARCQIVAWIEGWYNARRRHSSLGYLSPNDFEQRHAQIAATTSGCGDDTPLPRRLDGLFEPAHITTTTTTNN